MATPCVLYQWVQICIRAGKAKPKADKHKAPNNEMNNSKFGIATANKTIKIQMKKKIFSQSISNVFIKKLTCHQH